jgi:cupin 2 domain-containing protein
VRENGIGFSPLFNRAAVSLSLKLERDKSMNFFETLPTARTGEERSETLLEHPSLTIERIVSNRLSDGEWYDQDHDEWVLLAEGEATIAYADGSLHALQKGDYLLIPARRRHRVLSTSEDALWLALHLHSPAD